MKNKFATYEKDKRLDKIYYQEELAIGKKIHKISLIISIFIFIILSILMLFIFFTKTVIILKYNMLANFIGLVIFTLYNIIFYLLLKKNKYRPYFKYLNCIINVTIVTAILLTYSKNSPHNMVHSLRSAVITAYYMVIAISAIYQNRTLCFFCGILVAIQYNSMVIYAILNKTILYSGNETFFRPTYSMDVYLTHTSFFLVVSIILGLTIERFKKIFEKSISAEIKANLEKEHTLQLEEKTKNQLVGFLKILAEAIESKDNYTGGHVERVANYSKKIAELIKLSPEEVNNIYLGAMVHDIGKIGVKDAILNKKNIFKKIERKEIEKHPEIAKKMLRKISDLKTACDIASYHHEKWDGSGYPVGLKGNEIPLAARIVTIADVWDAIINPRPYRAAMPFEKAVKTMLKEKGKTFDPELFEIFMQDIQSAKPA